MFISPVCGTFLFDGLTTAVFSSRQCAGQAKSMCAFRIESKLLHASSSIEYSLALNLSNPKLSSESLNGAGMIMKQVPVD